MATLTSKQRKDIKKQLDAIQGKINEIKAQRASSSQLPTATAQPTTAAQSDALKYGAAGRGEIYEGMTDQEAADYNKKIQTATESGVPMSELGSPTGNKKNPNETYLDKPGKFVEPKLTPEQAGRYVSSFGLEGIVDSKKFAGKTATQVNQLLLQERAKRTGQVSANTSFAFNPEILKRTQRAIDKFGFALDEATNDPFEHPSLKDEAVKNVLEVSGKELGSLFESPDQLYNAYNTNQQFRDSLDKFIKKGGTLDSVSKNISGPMTVDNQITNAMVDRGELPESSREIYAQNIQSDTDFLASLNNPQANQEAQKTAMEELAPELQISQDEIARVSGIPKQLQSLYFGDEKTMGLLQMKQQQNIEKVRILEEQEKDAKRTSKDKVRLSIEREKVAAEQAESEIEENRLAARNYMTAQLAKLGALNTTGTAPLALQTLETKYQGKVTQIRSSFKFFEREMEIGLDERLDEIENLTDEKILNIQEDITKDRETSIKDVLKAQTEADKEIYRIKEQTTRRLRERTTKYTDDLKKEAEKYAKEFAKNASNGLDGGPLGLNNYSEGEYVDGKGVLLPNGKFAKLDLTPTQTTQVQSANLSGANTIRYFISLPEKFRGMIVQEAQGTGAKFSTIDQLKSRFEQLKAEDESDDEEEFEPL